MSVTRIAPTPSGYLHEGNVVNFALTAAVARLMGLKLALRIDDADAARAREEYVDDIFRVLAWLDVAVDSGPRSTFELVSTYSQTTRTSRYWTALRAGTDAGLPTFVCVCSRTQLVQGRCLRGCAGTIDTYQVGSRVRWRHRTGDIVLWGNHDKPTYHWANVVDDADMGTTHIVRGLDLIDSTDLHVALAPFVSTASPIVYAHHPLLTRADGTKLSKSQGTTQLDLSEALRDRVTQHVLSFLDGVLEQLVAGPHP